jgi:hypothetical protein
VNLENYICLALAKRRQYSRLCEKPLEFYGQSLAKAQRREDREGKWEMLVIASKSNVNQ